MFGPSAAHTPPVQPVSRAQGLTKVYRTGEVEVHALRGVDLELLPGEFVVLLGASGSGKSTLVNILGGRDAPRRCGRELRSRLLHLRRQDQHHHRRALARPAQSPSRRRD